ncbi:MAG: protein translocase subunit SecF [Candidatus Rhabdochlamydia sp.]
MEKPKRWHFYSIALVFILTLYHILPTVLFYTQPLKESVNEQQGDVIAAHIAHRVNQLEHETIDWITSFCSLIKINPLSIQIDPENPQLLLMKFHQTEEAMKFRYFLLQAQPYVPCSSLQLEVCGSDLDAKSLYLQRKIPLHFTPSNIYDHFTYGKVADDAKTISPLYQELTRDRIHTLLRHFTAPSQLSVMIQSALTLNDVSSQDTLVSIGKTVMEATKLWETAPALRQRYFAWLFQNGAFKGKDLISTWITALDRKKDQLKLKRMELSSPSASQETSLENREHALQEVVQQEKALGEITAFLRKYKEEFAKGKTVSSANVTASSLTPLISSSQTFSLQNCHPFIESITLDWKKETLQLNLYEDILSLKEQLNLSSQEKLMQLIENTVVATCQQGNETVLPLLKGYIIPLTTLENMNSFLVMDLQKIAQLTGENLKSILEHAWNPIHPDLQRDVFPIYTTATEDRFAIVISSPSFDSLTPSSHSITLEAKGLKHIIEKGEQNSKEPDLQQQLYQDLNALQQLLTQQQFHFHSVEGSSLLFTSTNYPLELLKATRESFLIHGSKRYAILEFSDQKQRMITENQIEDQQHQELLKWKDNYCAAQAKVKGMSRLTVPKPTKNPFLSNLRLSTLKYFRGDDRKILKWGLDLSGGKTVQIQLQDHGGKAVSDEMSLKQGMKELYNRVNQLGVSEVTIRQEGDHLTLDFPGAQSIWAKELIQASSMFFHVVNEQFMHNPALVHQTHEFLSQVWQEAITTGKKELSQIQLIAWHCLHGQEPYDLEPFTRTAAAQILYDAGLRLAHPATKEVSSLFDVSLSQVAYVKDNHSRAHPLTLVFSHYALTGADLEQIEASYNPNQGNVLSFTVKKTALLPDQTACLPQEDLYLWSSYFCEEGIQGTPLAAYSGGKGWRMGVILNGKIIAEPSLSSPIKEGGTVTGSFTQREIAQLEADLKAGSLSFTPKILSEYNISPELGKQERNGAIYGMITSFCCASFAMITLYRFAGVIASFALIFNLLIMWASLQMIGVALTLPAVAAVILTVAMSIDGAVLIFERVREELVKKKSLLQAFQIGYHKASSAILDSNITLLIAALILFQFDAGPIRGLAVTLIIGILSSLFVSLFAMRVFWIWWLQNRDHFSLNLKQLPLPQQVNFFKFTPAVMGISTCFIIAGSYLFLTHENSLLGMDFKGGYSLIVTLESAPNEMNPSKLEAAFSQAGLTPSEFQIRQLHPANTFRLFLSKSLDEPGKPFAPLSFHEDAQENNNEKIAWVVQTLEHSDIVLEADSFEHLEENWNEITGQLSHTMKQQAFWGMSSALGAIFIYISLRFEWRYGLSATLCLIYDLLFCLSSIALLNRFKVPLQLDFHTVGALMTIIGYSLNDTIIVFDRIREDRLITQGKNFHMLINHALNATLGRTLMTSATALLVLFPLLIWGRTSLFGFALVMVIGVIVGTFSSLFIAAPLMGWFHQYRLNK